MAVTLLLGLVPSCPASLVFEIIDEGADTDDGLDANSPGVTVRTQLRVRV